MKDMRLTVAKELNKIAKELVATGDYEYIYDPEHKKHPGGGFVKTDKGWQKGKEKKDSGNDSSENIVKLTPKQKQLDKLVNNRSSRIRMRILESEETHPSTLAKLADDPEAEIRAKVALNKKTPTEVVDKLAKDANTTVQAFALKNPNISVETLVEFSKPEYRDWHPNTYGYHPSLQETAISNPKMPKEILVKLSQSDNHSERNAVAENKSTPPEILDKLSRDKSQLVRRTVAQNPNTPEKALYDLQVDESKYVRNSANYQLTMRAKENYKQRVQNTWKQSNFDITKLSPELRRKIEDWDIEEIEKFIGWLKENKG